MSKEQKLPKTSGMQYHTPTSKISERVDEIHKLECNFQLEKIVTPNRPKTFLNYNTGKEKFKNVEKRINDLTKQGPNVSKSVVYESQQLISENLLITALENFQDDRSKLALSSVNTKKLGPIFKNEEKHSKLDANESKYFLAKLHDEAEMEYINNDISVILGKAMSLDNASKNIKLFNWTKEKISKIQSDGGLDPVAKLDKMQGFLLKVLSIVLDNLVSLNRDEAYLIQTIWNTQVSVVQNLLYFLPLWLKTTDSKKEGPQNDFPVSADDLDWHVLKGEVNSNTLDMAIKRIKVLDEKLKFKEFLLKKYQDDTLSLLAELNKSKDRAGDLPNNFDSNVRFNQTRSSQIPQRASRLQPDFLIRTNLKPSPQGEGRNTSNFNADETNQKGTLSDYYQRCSLEARINPERLATDPSSKATDKNYFSNSLFKNNNSLNVLKYYIDRGNGNSKRAPKASNSFMSSVGVNTVLTTYKDVGINTIRDDSGTKVIIKPKLVEKAVDTVEFRTLRHFSAATQSDVAQKFSSVEVLPSRVSMKSVSTETMIEAKSSQNRYVQVELDEKVHKMTDTIELVKKRKLQKKYKETNTSRNFDEDLFNSKSTDTADLFTRHDKQVTVNIVNKSESVGVQTDMRELAEIASSELALSPMLPKGRGKSRIKDDTYSFTLKKIEDVRNTGPLMEADLDTLKINQKAHEFEEVILSEKIDINKELEGLSSIKQVTVSAQKEIFEKLENLKENLKKYFKEEISTYEEICRIIDANQSCVGTHISRIEDRDLELKLQIIDIKTRECERELEVKDLEASVNSWKKRFNNCFEKYKNLKSVLETPQENQFFVKIDNKQPIFSQEVSKDNSTMVNTSKSQLSIIKEQIEEGMVKQMPANKLSRRNTLNTDANPTFGQATSIPSKPAVRNSTNNKPLKKLPSVVIESNKEFINVETIEKTNQLITKGVVPHKKSTKGDSFSDKKTPSKKIRELLMLIIE